MSAEPDASRTSHGGRGGKIALGVLAFLPMLGFVVYFGFFVVFFVGDPMGDAFVWAFFTVLLLAIVLVFGPVIALLVNLARNPRLSADSKALWALVLLGTGAMACPVYWYVCVWRDPSHPGTT